MRGANCKENLRYLAAFFKREEDLFNALKEARNENFEIEDVFTPFPLHGLDAAMGIRPSRLTWVAFLAGTLGLIFGLTLQIWTSVYDWPLTTGGKPFNSFPLFIPVAFELTVLFSGLLTILALFITSKLWFFSNRQALECVTDDSFVLILRQQNGGFDLEAARRLFNRNSAFNVVEGDRMA
ncbi:MAG: DUF3341 domain-containing protein [Acidobacteriota bacterium]